MPLPLAAPPPPPPPRPPAAAAAAAAAESTRARRLAVMRRVVQRAIDAARPHADALYAVRGEDVRERVARRQRRRTAAMEAPHTKPIERLEANVAQAIIAKVALEARVVRADDRNIPRERPLLRRVAHRVLYCNVDDGRIECGELLLHLAAAGPTSAGIPTRWAA